jgi:hypothetical protein
MKRLGDHTSAGLRRNKPVSLAENHKIQARDRALSIYIYGLNQINERA